MPKLILLSFETYPIQRTEYKRWVEGKTSTMTEKRRQDLEELGFTFPKRKSSKNIETKTWDESFLDLLQFRDVYGHVFVPPSYPQLGQWVTNQVNMQSL